MDSKEFQLGELAYKAYCVTTGGRSAITGAELPSFRDTPELVQAGWIAAAQTIQVFTQSTERHCTCD